MNPLATSPMPNAYRAYSIGPGLSQPSAPEGLSTRQDDLGADDNRQDRAGAAARVVAATAPMSVVIPARDASATLGHVLDALANVRPAMEVVVVDDHSADTTARLACRHPLHPTVVRLPRRSGPGVARNIGVALTGCPTICFLDADMLVPPDSLVEHAVNAGPQVVGQGFRYDLRLDAQTGALPPAAAAGPLNPEADDGAAPRLRARAVDGAFLSVPRAAYLSVGGFDPDFSRGWSYEDRFLVARLIAAGAQFAPLRRAVGFHLLTRHGEALRNARQPLRQRNLQLYLSLLESSPSVSGAARVRQHTDRLLRESRRLA